MIEFQNASYSHSKGNGVNNLNLRIDEGEFAFMIGPTGSGKTTLMRLIYFDLIPDAGIVIVGEYSSNTMTTRKIPIARKGVGMVFQDYKLLNDRNLFDNTALPLHALGFPAKEIIDRVDEALDLVGLESKVEHLPLELSGGEQQRIFIARALAQQGDTLLLDEPTANLDLQHQTRIFDQVKSLAKKGVTILAAIHDLNIAARYCDRLILMNNGN